MFAETAVYNRGFFLLAIKILPRRVKMLWLVKYGCFGSQSIDALARGACRLYEVRVLLTMGLKYGCFIAVESAYSGAVLLIK
ncbi:MAG: hypothetical protein MJZ41_09000 [Bacteroidaceae bacterium]|nr:hypothetical protein [Bacteroidaceae bacterium]